jgi:outer membrane protein OmpA-like peptidoglycan-associated protein
VGLYDVVVTNSDGQSATLKEGFTVEVFRPAISPNKLLKPIYFDFDKFNLRRDQNSVLNFDLKILNDNPELFILLGGHTDERGTREYNLELSSKRANTIKTYLVSKGIDPERITVYSYGKDYLLKTGHSEEDQKYNRRVDILMWEAPPTREQGIRNPNHVD